MLSENLKSLRKQRGLTQEEMAARLHIVRQTISKWEKGLSVPDAETLVNIADLFEVSTGELLGTSVSRETNPHDIAEQLSRINEQLVIKNRRARRIWGGIIGVLLVFALLQVTLLVISMVSLERFDSRKNVKITSQSEVLAASEELPEDAAGSGVDQQG